jgi:hypothetical protein
VRATIDTSAWASVCRSTDSPVIETERDNLRDTYDAYKEWSINCRLDEIGQSQRAAACRVEWATGRHLSITATGAGLRWQAVSRAYRLYT